MGEETLKVLVVDDSLIFRTILEEALGGEEDIQVVGSVRNGAKAIEFLKEVEVRPNIVTLDIEMPVMGGLEALDKIQELNDSTDSPDKIGVIMVSSHTSEGAKMTIKALELGAYDFIDKPATDNLKESLNQLKTDLLLKVRQYRTKKRKPSAAFGKMPKVTAVPRSFKPSSSGSKGKVKAVVIGVSTGGPKALAAMLPLLSEAVHVPIFIVQHMPPIFTQSLSKSLNSKCRHKVVEAIDNQLIQPDHAYVAPGGVHMVLRKELDGRIVTALNSQPLVNGCRPSVDVMFRSVPSVFSGDVVALILTGMGNDGAKALAPLKRAGAHVIVQDEASSVVWGMPGSAVASGFVDNVLPLLDIPGAVTNEINSRDGSNG